MGLQEANRGAGLQVLSLTGQRGEDSLETAREKGSEMGIEHPIGFTAYFGEQTPYLNMNVNAGLTFAFVIGKDGGLRWQGNHAGDRDEFLDAVRSALNAPAASPLSAGLAPDLAPELADAVEYYVTGEYDRAGTLADKLSKRFGGKSGADAQRLAELARELRAAVDQTASDFTARLDTALAERDPEALLRASSALERGFSRDVSKRAAGVRKAALKDPEWAEELEAWEAWLELEAERPPLFPVVQGKQEERYARRLTRWLGDRTEGPGVDRARAWLERWGG